MNFINLIPYIFVGCIIAIIIVFLFIIVCKLDNIKYRQNICESELNDIKELISNVVQGSKRIERNVDAINQRTRAEKNKKTPAKEKRGNVYEANKSNDKSHKKNTRNKYSATTIHN